jgi:hypothetical protein
MGGSGSGRWWGHRKARTVESCCCLSVQPGGKVGGTVPNGSWTLTQEKEAGSEFMVLRGSKDGWRAEEWIEFIFWDPRFGGRSIWLLCPGCGKRFRKLYAPPGAAKFRCRRCWKLAYISSQEAHKWDRGALVGIICMATGQTPNQIEKAMRADFKAQRAELQGR